MRSECKYWAMSDAFADGDADILELTEVPCCQCSRCRQAASDGVLMAFEDADEDAVHQLLMILKGE